MTVISELISHLLEHWLNSRLGPVVIFIAMLWALTLWLLSAAAVEWRHRRWTYAIILFAIGIPAAIVLLFTGSIVETFVGFMLGGLMQFSWRMGMRKPSPQKRSS
jgi:hypothetical protein